MRARCCVIAASRRARRRSFSGMPEINFHAAQLASLFVRVRAAVRNRSRLESRYRVGSLESGALLCQVYEAYTELHAPAGISFEHAWFLLLALARRDELGIARCPVCGGMRLRDLLAKRRPACANCEPNGAAAPLPSINERAALLEFAG